MSGNQITFKINLAKSFCSKTAKAHHIGKILDAFQKHNASDPNFVNDLR